MVRAMLPALALVAVTPLLFSGGCKKESPESSERPAPPPAPSSEAVPAADAKAQEDEHSGGHEVLSPELLRTHTQALSDDAMEGRGPGTPGGTRAVQYIVTAMTDLGLQPAGEEEEFTQAVKMRAVQTKPESFDVALVGAAGSNQPLRFGEDVVGGTFGEAGAHTIDAPLVFAGYGVDAPEYDWNDLGEHDLEGKILVVFVGDPPVDDGRFGGDAMTYYGRWTYKFEQAAQAGAAGCLVVHESEPASYGWNVVRNSWSSERFQIVEADGSLPSALQFQGWISKETAEALAKRAGSSLRGWHEQAMKPDFRARDLGVRLKGSFTTSERRLSDVNVVGKIPGAKHPDQAVYITAHWDHLGTKQDAGPDEDAIFNGAVDNASGIAGMLGIAAGIQAEIRAGNPPARSIVFLATTAEEQGLLGSQYHAAHPSTPLEKILGVINIDSMNVHGAANSVQVIGFGQSDLEDTLATVVAEQDRRVVPDEHPESGGFYRSDHFSFAKKGVPAIYFRGGTDMREGGEAAGEALATKKAERYHTVEDEFDPNWSFEGAEQDAEAVMDLALGVANAEAPPRWKPQSEFAKLRPASD